MTAEHMTFVWEASEFQFEKFSNYVPVILNKKKKKKTHTSFVIESTAMIGGRERERERVENGNVFHFYHVILFGIQFKFCQAINEMKLTFILKTRDIQIANQKWMLQGFCCFFFSLFLIYTASDFQSSGKTN